VTLGSLLALAAGLSKRGELTVRSAAADAADAAGPGAVAAADRLAGIGEAAKVALIAFATTFPIYLNLYNGVRGVDVRLVEAAAASASAISR